MVAAIKTNTLVKAITRHGADKVTSSGRESKPFVLAVSNGAGEVRRDLARAVIDASGTWASPNPLGAGGIFAEGEVENETTSSTESLTCSAEIVRPMSEKPCSSSALGTRRPMFSLTLSGLPHGIAGPRFSGHPRRQNARLRGW